MLKLAHTVQQTKEYTKPIYFFNLGYIHLLLPDSLAEHKENTRTVIHNHLILIGENNIRFKADICTKREYVQSDKHMSTQKIRVQTISLWKCYESIL